MTKTVEKKEVWVAEYYLISIVIRWLYGSSINLEDVLKLFLLLVAYGCFWRHSLCGGAGGWGPP